MFMHVFIKCGCNYLILFVYTVHAVVAVCVCVSVYGVSVCIEVLEFTVLIIINIIIRVSADIYSVYNR